LEAKLKGNKCTVNKMYGEKGSSKADTLVKVVLVFFISLLSFSVGTFVGKQVSDSDHRRMALEGEYKAERQIASEEHAAKDEEAGAKITEKEVENLTEEFINQEKVPQEGAETHTAGTAEDHKSEDHKDPKSEEPAEGYKEYKRAEKPTDATHETAHKVAEGVAPSDGKKEERKPSSVLPSVASSAIGKYTVQVASYADENEAKNQAATLKAKGWTAFYLPAQVNGKTWYRVTVGLFDNYRAAQDFQGQFMKEAKVKSAIVQKIVQ
jgi:septal ring-binding cell division protein DamX